MLVATVDESFNTSWTVPDGTPTRSRSEPSTTHVSRPRGEFRQCPLDHLERGVGRAMVVELDLLTGHPAEQPALVQIGGHQA